MADLLKFALSQKENKTEVTKLNATLSDSFFFWFVFLLSFGLILVLLGLFIWTWIFSGSCGQLR